MKGARKNTFVMHSLEMRESPAWRHLPDKARRLLDRLEIEHMRHGNARNGELIVPYEKLEAAGLRRMNIARAIRQCEALGFLAVTERGGLARGGHKWSSKYRLTYVKGIGESPPPTDEWKKITSNNIAKIALESIENLSNGRGGRGKVRKSKEEIQSAW